jgi:hypothetical protein
MIIAAERPIGFPDVTVDRSTDEAPIMMSLFDWAALCSLAAAGVSAAMMWAQ